MSEIRGIKIGNQIWAEKNLNTDRFRNGDIIPAATNPEQWLEAGNNKQPSWCYYDFDRKFESIHGKLYNWYAVVDQRGLAPAGWHIPQTEDWNELISFLGESPRNKIRSFENWEFGNSGTDRFMFNAYPSGCCNSEGIGFDMNEWACWWSSTEWNESDAVAYNISNEFNEFGCVNDDKRYGLSIRYVNNLIYKSDKQV